MGFFRYFIMIFALLTLALPGVALAACASPVGTAGEVRFDLADNAIEYCNGAAWVSLPRAPNNTCSNYSSWSSVTIPANAWNNVAFGAGRFVIVATNGTSRVMHSTDGIVWTAPTMPTVQQWADIVYANGQFVAVGSNTTTVGTSPDGITWTDRTGTEASQWHGITYGNGYYVAVSRNGTNRVMRSVDGITWTAHAAAEANQWFDVAYGNGLFVAVTTLGTNQVMTSPDGATWTARAVPAAQWQSVAFGNGRFVASAPDSPNNIMTSTDGINWTTQTLGGTWTAAEFLNGMFVLAASDSTATNNIATSTDGLSWTTATLPEANNWNSIAFGNGRFVTVSGNGTYRAAVSNCSTGNAYNWGIGQQINYVPHPTANWWDNFGRGVATNGSRIVTGAPGSDVDVNAAGLVYVFDATGTTPALTVHNPAPGDTEYFGWRNAIDGNLFVSSSPGYSSGTKVGRAYVFNATTGALVSTLINPDPTANDDFSSGVSISGNLVAIGAPNNDQGASNAGSVYIFNATTGAVVTTIHNPAPAIDDHFGFDVDIDGNYVVIGAPDDDPGGVTNAGSVYVYNATTGALISTWANPLPSSGDQFGFAVAIDGNIAVVGAGVGNAVVSYSFNATTGATIATFNNPDGGASDFGQSVDIDGEFAVIGAGSNDVAGSNSGAIYIYNVNSGALAMRILNPEITSFDENMGGAVAMKNGIIVAGAPNDDIGEGDGSSGSFHVIGTRSYCSSPSGAAGTMRYNADHRVVQWCDGTNWQAAGPPDPGGPSGGCSTPTATAGFVTFSSTSCTLQYCDGGAWQSMGGKPSSPCACGASGGQWTKSAAPVNNSWRTVIGGDAGFVAFSWDGGANKVMHSTDGVTWNVRPVSTGAIAAAYGNGRYLGIAPFGGRDVIISTDGINWTTYTNAMPAANNWYGLAYGNGLFVAVAQSGAQRVATSPDGITWTPRTVTVNDYYTISYGNGRFVAPAYNTAAAIYSTDGITWNNTTTTDVGWGYNSGSFGNGVFLYGNGGLMRSTDGITWTDVPTSYGPNRLVYGAGRWIATDGSNAPITSTDNGTTWTPMTFTSPEDYGDTAYYNSTFVMTGESNTNRIARICVGE